MSTLADLPRRALALLVSLRHARSLRWLAYGVVVGAVTGLVAAAYFWAVEYFRTVLLHDLAGLSLPAPAGEQLHHATPLGAYRPWLVPLFTGAVGLITGYVVQRFIPETVSGGTDGTDATIKAFHQQGGLIRPLVPIIRGVASIFTIASGGSAGREGPITQMGAGLGSWFAQRLKLSARERRLLLLAGAAGGLGAIFRAPLGGALTAVEVIYREDFEAEALLPSIMSSVTAYSVFTFFFGSEPIFGIPHFEFRDPRELFFYTALALACAGAGWLYVRTFRWFKFRIFFPLKEKVGLMWTTALGGLGAGLLGAFFPQVLSGGYGWLELAILGQIPALMLFAIVIGKTMATSMTIGSGMSGGMFAPALFVGGMSGGVVGQLAHQWWPDIARQPGGYVLVGMAAFFAGIAKAPIGPLVMVCELTKGYGLLAPLMLASALCIVLCRKVSLYEHQVDDKFDSPAHVSDATINVLEHLTVEGRFTPSRVTILEEGTTLKALTDIIANTAQICFPVRDRTGRFTGILSIHDVRRLLFEEGLFDLVVVHDLAGRVALLKPDDDLYTALLLFVDTDYDQIPVVSPGDPHALVGLMNREDVFKAYATTIRSLREDAV